MIICENRQLYMSCDHTPGTVLNIVHANYGRTSGDRCHHKYMSNKYCYAANSTTIVRNLCEGKVSCRVSAYNSVFGGDPCPGTYKYLEIRFQCKTSGLYFSTAGLFSGELIHLQGRQLCQNCLCPLLKGVHSIRKEFAPRGSKFFPY